MLLTCCAERFGVKSMKAVKAYIPEDCIEFLDGLGSVAELSRSMMLKYIVLAFYSEVTGQEMEADYRKLLDLLVQLHK